MRISRPQFLRTIIGAVTALFTIGKACGAPQAILRGKKWPPVPTPSKVNYDNGDGEWMSEYGCLITRDGGIILIP